MPPLSDLFQRSAIQGYAEDPFEDGLERAV